MVESWDIIMKPQTRANLVDRWDWHAWQFLAALIPSFIILGLASYADKDMEARNTLMASARERAIAEAGQSLQPQKSESLLRFEATKVDARITALEQQVQKLLDMPGISQGKESRPDLEASAKQAIRS